MENKIIIEDYKLNITKKGEKIINKIAEKEYLPLSMQKGELLVDDEMSIDDIRKIMEGIINEIEVGDYIEAKDDLGYFRIKKARNNKIIEVQGTVVYKENELEGKEGEVPFIVTLEENHGGKEISHKTLLVCKKEDREVKSQWIAATWLGEAMDIDNFDKDTYCWEFAESSIKVEWVEQITEIEYDILKRTHAVYDCTPDRDEITLAEIEQIREVL